MKTKTTQLLVLLGGLLCSSVVSFAQQTHSAKSNFFELDLRTSTEPDTWYTGSADLGGNWRWLPWLESFNVSAAPWIYHAQHGWLYAIGDSSEDLYLWDEAMGSFLWTSETAYPSLYRFSDSAWIYYLKGSDNPRDFVDLSTGIWEQW